jgi:hypothetical protein
MKGMASFVMLSDGREIRSISHLNCFRNLLKIRMKMFVSLRRGLVPGVGNGADKEDV